ncbi:MAG: UDP-N-acetylmuramoyl-L-alanyl-D-glutamate--2,6-diaminopimelate ligase, partial [Eggerthellaceae bacterium]|nr:UDP-N-acetylmuramoyl-L-alanyl-D-glutamate--2,6-diaminopimelate ligase [Eggerthellaceae bacterium]
MIKSCKDIFSGFECRIIGDANTPVSGIAYNSSSVKPGYAFFCIPGIKTDGLLYAQDAIDKGACVIVCEHELAYKSDKEICFVTVADARDALAFASDRYFEAPSHKFDLVGVTGTNGKTSTVSYIDSIVKSFGKKTGLIGTLGNVIDGAFEETSHTTPESFDLQSLFARMAEASCDVVSMEVSSHALDLKRVAHTRYKVTVFTNLTQDHLDYHHDMERYFEAKKLLFTSAYPAKRVICTDDEWGRRLYDYCNDANDDIITTGFDEKADIHPESFKFSEKGSHMTLSVMGKRFALDTALIGKFNVSNAMSAIGACMALGYDTEAIIDVFSGVSAAPGRLERVLPNKPYPVSVYIDYAHTPDALQKAIGALKDLTEGNLWVVFGCGGDRDKTKRPVMGRIALSADGVVVTSDNPRTEDPQIIID